jgi:hypothetical protein
MAMSFIKKPIEKSTGLRKLLHRQLAGVDQARPITRIHASDVTYDARPFCPRERAYLIANGKKPGTQRISTSEHMTFGIGHAVEDMIIDAFVEMGRAIGDWECMHCGRMHRFSKKPVVCSNKDCGHKHFKYVELRVTSPVTGVSCGIDLVLDMPGDALHSVVEIKSMDKEVFKSLVAPLAEHDKRSKLYLQSLAESEEPWTNLVRTDRAFILYSTKGGYGNACEEVPMWDFWDAPFSPFKDYVIQRDDASIAKVVEKPLQYKAWSDAVQAWRDAGEIGTAPTLPPRICTSSLEKRAKACSCQVECWQKQQGG